MKIPRFFDAEEAIEEMCIWGRPQKIIPEDRKSLGYANNDGPYRRETDLNTF